MVEVFQRNGAPWVVSESSLVEFERVNGSKGHRLRQWWHRGDPQNGWDTDQFPNSVEDLVMPLYEIVQAGGLGSGGFNFDAKLRRQSIDGPTSSTPTSAGSTRSHAPSSSQRSCTTKGRSRR